VSAYHNRRSRVLTRLALLHPDEYADLMAHERVNDGLDPERGHALVARCGTRPGYARHRRNDEDPCGPCTLAVRNYRREYLRAKRQETT